MSMTWQSPAKRPIIRPANGLRLLIDGLVGVLSNGFPLTGARQILDR